MKDIVEEIARALYAVLGHEAERVAGSDCFVPGFDDDDEDAREFCRTLARAAYEVMARSDGEDWRSNARFLLSVIDSCDEAEAPSGEMDPQDTAIIAEIRKALGSSGHEG